MTNRQADAHASLRAARRYEKVAEAAYAWSGDRADYHELCIASRELEGAIQTARAAGLDCDDSGLLL